MHQVIFESLTRKIDSTTLADVRNRTYSFEKIEILFIFQKADINKLINLQNFDEQLMNQLVNIILDVKWPKKESEMVVFEFLFSFLHFFKTFLHLGNYFLEFQIFKN